MVTLQTQICEFCGKEYHFWGKYKRKYCSKGCNSKAKYQRDKATGRYDRLLEERRFKRMNGYYPVKRVIVRTPNQQAVFLQKQQEKAINQISEYITKEHEKPVSTLDDTLRMCNKKGISFAEWQTSKTLLMVGGINLEKSLL